MTATNLRRPKRGTESSGRTADVTPLVSREERKQRTREGLLDAALQLMSQGRSFTSLSLREVTREAGVVPTAFYRHFRDMDELGLALVEEGGITLRRMLREARQEGVPLTDVIRSSVKIYKLYVKEHQLQFLFIVGERAGGSPVIRAAVRNEVSHFVNEMAQDLRHLNVLPKLAMPSLQLVCSLVVNTMLSAAADVIDLPRGRPEIEEEMTENFVRQLRMIFLGAAQWRETATTAS